MGMRLSIACTLAASIALAAGGPLPPVAAQTYRAGTIEIEAPWVRATPAGARVAGGYMKIRNTGTEADRLIGGSSAVAGKLEVHEMKVEGSLMRMRELPRGLEIRPGESVELKPGSLHIMLVELKHPLKEGDSFKGTLRFEKAGEVEVDYVVRSMGSKSGRTEGGHGHGGHGTRH